MNNDVPNMNVASGAFGLITQTQQGIGLQAGPRTIQMLLRFRV